MTVCTLHKLIEQIEDKSIRNSIAFDDRIEYVNHVINKTQILAPMAMCFHMGHADKHAFSKSMPELFKLPYKVCWFEGEFTAPDEEILRIGMFCNEDSDGIKTIIYAWKKEFEKWVLVGSVRAMADMFVCPVIRSQYIGGTKEFNDAVIQWLAAFLSALNCCNINRVKTTPDEKLQRARSKRGKKPLFEFWTLEIDLERSEKEDCDWGGTHASPRFHLRRGHARQHKKGHWCWVRACAVGNKNSGGMVHKEYAVR